MLRGRFVDITGGLALLLVVLADWQFKVSPWVYLILFITYAAIIAFGSATISSQFFIRTRCQGDPLGGAIAITFDDGPIAGMTDKILDILNEHEVPAAFFCIGQQVEAAPDLLRRIHREGHLIGNHSYYHGKFFDLQSTAKMSRELKLTDDAIENSIGQRPRYFRPPYGVTNPMLAQSVKVGGYTTVGWNVRSMDTVIRKKEKLISRVLKNLKAGDLVLFHDYAGITIEVLPEFLTSVKRKGLRVERLDNLLQEKPYV